MPYRKHPVFLNLLKIHLPLMGWVSIAHRLTGLILFLLLPLPLWLWQHSLNSVDGFVRVSEWLGTWPLRMLLLLMLWWFLHHLFAGLRLLLLDMEIGSSLKASRGSASVVLMLDALVLVVGVWLL